MHAGNCCESGALAKDKARPVLCRPTQQTLVQESHDHMTSGSPPVMSLVTKLTKLQCLLLRSTDIWVLLNISVVVNGVCVCGGVCLFPELLFSIQCLCFTEPMRMLSFLLHVALFYGFPASSSSVSSFQTASSS